MFSDNTNLGMIVVKTGPDLGMLANPYPKTNGTDLGMLVLTKTFSSLLIFSS